MKSMLTYIIVGQLLFSAGLSSTTEFDSLSIVTKECEAKLSNINSLSEFKEFMKHYRVVVKTMDKPKKGLLNSEKNLRKCFDQRDMLFALEELMTNQGDGVCQLEYIDKLIEYHLKSMVKPDEDKRQQCTDDLSVKTRKSFAARIFSLYTHQVVFTCKSKLVDRVVHFAEPQYECGDVLDLILPVDISKTESDDDRLIKFREFLSNFDRVENFNFFFSKSKLFESYFEVSTSKEAAAKVQKLKELCQAREPFYLTLFQPISSLSQLGYEVEYVPADSDTLRCWLTMGQFCQGILRLHTQTESIDAQESPYVKIKFDKPPSDVVIRDYATNRQLPDVMRFKDNVDKFAPLVIELVNKRSSMAGKLKRKLKLVKRFLSNRVKIDDSPNQVAKHFKDVITRAEDDLSSACAYNGRQKASGVFAPMSLLTNELDTILAMVSLGVSHIKAFIINTCTAVGFTAVFAYFLTFAGTKVVKSKLSPKADTTDNFKSDYLEMLDNHKSKLEDSVEKKGIDKKILGQVYVGSTKPLA